LTSGPDDPGSPYAIGSADGGHDAVHPQLGTLDDFGRLVAACADYGMEIALDFAVQCSPDHPWLTQHPEWFKRRPDGSIQYAENPPKKYEDIVNPDFYGADRDGLWRALRDVVLFWVRRGVRIFRVDNPHTKPFPFWEWLIRDVQEKDADVIFLAEAFTRPKIMQQLAKLGFTQSYSYFTWRNTKLELTTYLEELTRGPSRHYMRPNFFVNTPDINPFYLQTSGRAGFQVRLILAATLGGNYGIYSGFELLEHEAIPGHEEYLDSEKYQIKQRDWGGPGNIKPYVTELNRVRNENAALQQTANLRFLGIEDGETIAFAKEAADPANTVVAVIALSRQAREFWLPLGDLTIDVGGERRHVAALENLLTGEQSRIEWGGIKLRIDPDRDLASLFRCLA